MTADHQAIAELFERFRVAVTHTNASAFVALCVRDVAPQLSVFEKNARQLRTGKLQLKLIRIEQSEDAATVSFEVVDEQGARVDEASLTVSREVSGWRIRSL